MRLLTINNRKKIVGETISVHKSNIDVREYGIESIVEFTDNRYSPREAYRIVLWEKWVSTTNWQKRKTILIFREINENNFKTPYVVMECVENSKTRQVAIAGLRNVTLFMSELNQFLQ